MTPEELQKAPKLLCENIVTGTNPEYFVIVLFSGAESTSYALSPQHAKRFLQKLTHDITQYEKSYGEIKAQWNPNIVSPLQNVNPPDERS